MKDFVFLDETQTAKLLTMKEAVDVCDAVIKAQGLGQANLSEPAAMFLDADPSQPTKFKVKGGSLLSLDVSGFRIVGDVGPDGIIAEHHYCLLLDPVTGKPRGLVAQTELHRIRTAACGLLALRYLAPQDAHTFALIGAGKIGAAFALGFHDIFPDHNLIIASRRLEIAQDLANQNSSRGRRTLAMPIHEAATRADGIVTLTTATEPVMTSDMFRPGMTIVGMGEYHELPVAMLRQADEFVVDDIGFASVLGSVSHWIARGETTKDAVSTAISATLSAIAAGQANGRRSRDSKVLAIVQGLAIADLALADLCRRKIQ